MDTLTLSISHQRGAFDILLIDSQENNHAEIIDRIRYRGGILLRSGL